MERQPLPPSPCVGICTLRDNVCYGCGRTPDEIASWGTMTAAGQSAVWQELPGRLAAFGFKTFRLAAGPAVAAEFVARSFRETGGSWRLVGAGGEGDVSINENDRPQIREDAQAVTAMFADGTRLTLKKHDKVRVFGFSAAEDTPLMDTIALVLPKGRAQRDLKEADPVAEGFVPIVSDDPSIEAYEARSSGVFLLRNAFGSITTRSLTLREGVGADANSPPDIKISRAFVACAIFHCDDPDWLAAALAP